MQRHATSLCIFRDACRVCLPTGIATASEHLLCAADLCNCRRPDPVLPRRRCIPGEASLLGSCNSASLPLSLRMWVSRAICAYVELPSVAAFAVVSMTENSAIIRHHQAKAPRCGDSLYSCLGRESSTTDQTPRGKSQKVRHSCQRVTSQR